MSDHKIEQRLAALEVEVAELRKKVSATAPSPRPWWEVTVGSFADDPVFEEAMELGRQYRQSS